MRLGITAAGRDDERASVASRAFVHTEDKDATIATLEAVVRQMRRIILNYEWDVKRLRDALAECEFRLAVLARLQEVVPSSERVQ